MADAEVLSMIKSCIVSRKGGVPVNDINDDYKELVGERIPFRKFGFENLELYLQSLPGILISKNQNGVSFLTANDDKLAHINKLVGKQKVVPRREKKKTGSRVPAGKIWPQKQKLRCFDKTPKLTLSNVSTGPSLQQCKLEQPLRQYSQYTDSANVCNSRVAQSAPQLRSPGSWSRAKQHYKRTADCHQNAETSCTSTAPQSEKRNVHSSASGDYCWKGEEHTRPQHRDVSKVTVERLGGKTQHKYWSSPKLNDRELVKGKIRCPESVDPYGVEEQYMRMLHKNTSHQSEYSEHSRGSSVLSGDLCPRAAQKNRSARRSSSSRKSKPETSVRKVESVENEKLDYFGSSDGGKFNCGLKVSIQNVDREVRVVGDTLTMRVQNVPDPSCHILIDFNEFEDPPYTNSVFDYESLLDVWKPVFADHQMIGDDFFLHLAYKVLDEECVIRNGQVFQCGLCGSGQTIWECRERVLQSRSVAPNVLLLLGVADILMNMPVSDMKNHMVDLLEVLESRVASVVMLTIPPLAGINVPLRLNRRIITFNKWLKRLHTGVRFHVIDIWPLFVNAHDDIDYDYYERSPVRMFGCNDNVVLWNRWGREAVMMYLDNCLY